MNAARLLEGARTLDCEGLGGALWRRSLGEVL